MAPKTTVSSNFLGCWPKNSTRKTYICMHPLLLQCTIDTQIKIYGRSMFFNSNYRVYYSNVFLVTGVRNKLAHRSSIYLQFAPDTR